jgi:hypothetical protein
LLNDNCAMKTPKRGAPVKPPEERKDVLFAIRLTAAEKATIDAASDGKASAWARSVLLRAAKRRGH